MIILCCTQNYCLLLNESLIGALLGCKFKIFFLRNVWEFVLGCKERGIESVYAD